MQQKPSHQYEFLTKTSAARGLTRSKGLPMIVQNNNNFNARNFQVIYLIFTHTHNEGRQNNSVCTAWGLRGSKNIGPTQGQHEESGMPG